MKKKLKLNSLEVKSFVTKVDSAKEETVKGGRPLPLDTYKCLQTQDLFNCTWISELNTACKCDSTDWWDGCNEMSINIPCEA